MALTDPDDIIERLIDRDEIQISLKDVFDEDDLEKVIEDKLEGGSDEIKVRGSQGWFTTTKEDTKQRLRDNVRDLYDTKKINRVVITNITNVKDLDKIRDVINKDVEKPLTTRIGIERAKRIIKEDRFSSEAVDAVEFLRKYSPQTLGGLTVQEIRRTKSIQGLF